MKILKQLYEFFTKDLPDPNDLTKEYSMDKKYKIAVLGATGAVGREMIKVLEEYNVPVEELRLLASSRSEGSKLLFRGEEVTVHEAKPDSFSGMDFVLGAVGKGMAKQFAPHILEAGAVFIDNSSSFRMDPEVPLVVPDINAEDIKKHRGIISNPNCSTIITLMAVAGIAKLSPIETMVACTYQAVSGAGEAGIRAMEDETEKIVAKDAIVPTAFPAQIAMNVIPFIGSYTDNGYTDEEMKMQNEGRKILHLPEMKCTCTCVRVPVMRSHSISVTLRTRDVLDLDTVRAAVSDFPGVVLADDLDGRDYPTPLDTSDQDMVYVGRIRKDLTDERGITLWCCGDQIRKGAASNAVQILLKLINS